MARVEWNRSVSIAGPAAHSDDADRFCTSSGAHLLRAVVKFARNSPQCPFLCQTQAERAVDCPPLWCFPSNTSQIPALVAPGLRQSIHCRLDSGGRLSPCERVEIGVYWTDFGGCRKEDSKSPQREPSAQSGSRNVTRDPQRQSEVSACCP